MSDLAVPPPWHARLLPVSGFPVPATELEPLRRLAQNVAGALGARGLVSEVFLRLASLSPADDSDPLSESAPLWDVTPGLGVFPDREPPHAWTQEEFENLAPGEAPRILVDQVMRVGAPPPSRDQARDAMLGHGSVVQIFTPEPGGALVRKIREALLAPIRESLYRAFPCYAPLLDAASLRQVSAANLDSWLGGAVFYLRESPEDSGLLLLAREPYQHVLRI